MEAYLLSKIWVAGQVLNFGNRQIERRSAGNYTKLW